MTRPAPLPAAAVRVRWLAVASGDTPHLASWRAMLDAGETARADRYCFAADRDVFTAAHALARAMLSEATGQPTACWRYLTGRFGKPALAPCCAASGLRFNISHTRGLVACALAHGDVGVDVEASDRTLDLAVANSVFAPEEIHLLASAGAAQRACTFFRIWTLKEAFIKATGEGLHRPLASFSFAFDPLGIRFHPARAPASRHEDPATWQFAECAPAPHHRLALAVRRTGPMPLCLDARAAGAEEVAPWSPR